MKKSLPSFEDYVSLRESEGFGPPSAIDGPGLEDDNGKLIQAAKVAAEKHPNAVKAFLEKLAKNDDEIAAMIREISGISLDDKDRNPWRDEEDTVLQPGADHPDAGGADGD